MTTRIFLRSLLCFAALWHTIFPLFLLAVLVALPAFAESIHEAARKGNLKKVQALLQNNPQLVFNKDRGGDTPLILAAFGGYTDVAELLLADKADVNAKNNNGDSSLLLAVSGHYRAVVELLLANKANVDDANRNAMTPLQLAVYKGYGDLTKLLLAHNPDVNRQDSHGETPLLLAVMADRKDIAELLLAANADISIRDNNGYTPLLLAAYEGHRSLAELLLANKADVNAKNPNGDTPLHLATLTRHRDVVELLLANKADINLKDNAGATPLHLATLNHDDDMAELLRQHGSIDDGMASAPPAEAAPLRPAPTESICQTVKYMAEFSAPYCRAYPGPNRPVQEVAVLKLNHVRVDEIDGKSIRVCGYPRMALLQRDHLVCSPAKSIELVPGHYSITFAPVGPFYVYTVIEKYDPIVIDFHAEAGKTYDARGINYVSWRGGVGSWTVEIK